jgi:hypothetical protein
MEKKRIVAAYLPASILFLYHLLLVIMYGGSLKWKKGVHFSYSI